MSLTHTELAHVVRLAAAALNAPLALLRLFATDPGGAGLDVWHPAPPDPETLGRAAQRASERVRQGDGADPGEAGTATDPGAGPAILAVPVTVGDHPAGALVLLDPRPREWSEREGALARDAAAGAAGLVARAAEANAHRHRGRESARRDALLREVAETTALLLRSSDWRRVMPDALARLGRATGVSRAHHFESASAPDGTPRISLRHEWVAQGVEAQLGRPELEGASLAARGFARWERVLRDGGTIAGAIGDLPAAEQALLRPQGIRSLAVVPVFAGSEWLGFVGLDDCGEGRSWSATELDLLGTVAGSIGVAAQGARHLEALRASEESYRALFDHLTDAVYIQDLQGRFLKVNDAALRMSGFSREDVIGKTPHVLADPERVDMDAVMEHFQRAAAGEPQRFEWWGRRRDGSSFPKEVVLTRGTYFGQDVVIAIDRDLSERVRLQEQLVQARKMEAVGTLAGGVAHDFNNMLTAIQGFASFLEEELRSESGRESLLEIRRAAERSIGLTRQLLAFSRKQVLMPRHLELNAVVHGLELMLTRLIHESVTLETDLHPEPRWVRADPGQMEQVLVNLALNARDAMPDGGRLTLATRRVEFQAGATLPFPQMAPGPYVELSVVDTGHGMDERTMSQIFEPFFTTRKVGEGTGLGLATVYGIVKQSGGFIQAESQPGRGSAFRIFLPEVAPPGDEEAASVQEAPVGVHERVVRPAGAVPASVAAGSPRAAQPGTILLAEDEPGVRGFAARVLRAQGYTVLEAPDGRAALERFERDTAAVDLLVTDVVMPGLGGRALAARARDRRPDLPVLYLSGYDEGAIAGPGGEPLEGAFLAKPFRARELLERVRATLRARGA